MPHKISKEEAEEFKNHFQKLNNLDIKSSVGSKDSLFIQGNKLVFKREEIDKFFEENKGDLVIYHGSYPKGKNKNRYTAVLETTEGIYPMQKPGCC